MAELLFLVKNKEIFTQGSLVGIKFPYFFLATYRYFCFKRYMHPAN